MSSESCRHCGDHIVAPPRYTLDEGSERSFFCCPGCLEVFKIIRSSGLNNYYQFRTQTGDKPELLEDETRHELSVYDMDDVQSEFVHTNNQQEKETALSIEGITCAACIWLLEKHVGNVPGVRSFSINHSTQKAHVTWDKTTSLSEILISIYEIGYKARPYKDEEIEIQFERERKKTLIRLGIAGIAMMQSMMLAVPLYIGVISGITETFETLFRWISLFVATPVVLYSAQPFFIAALRDLKVRHLTMDVPVSLAILFAYLASAWITFSGGKEVYFDSVAMFTFFLLLGRYIETQSRHKAGIAYQKMQSLIPPSAIKLNNDGKHEVVAVNKLNMGDLILVKSATTIPVDGTIINGYSSIDESAVTGEFMPVNKTTGDQVIAGTVNVESPIEVEVSALGTNTRLNAIMRLIDRAQAEKPPVALLADRIARYFVLFVLLSTLSVFCFWTLEGNPDAFAIALSVLVVTCPCALSLATPTAMTAATSALRRSGLLVTRGHVLEGLAQVTDIVFDKTGTLTAGALTLSDTCPHRSIDQSDALAIAAALEDSSEHPIAKLFHPYGTGLKANGIKAVTGKGIEGVVEQKRYRIGTYDFATQSSTNLKPPSLDHWILLADDNGPIMGFLIEDSIRPSAKSMVQQLKNDGFSIHILSGDQSSAVANLAKHLNIDHVISGASPEAKLDYICALQSEKKSVMMVGDGLNDVPVMAGTQLSVAMGNANELTKLKADAVLLSTDLQTLSSAIHTGKKTRSVIRQNLTWAATYNLTMLPMAMLGYIPPYAAAIGMSLSSLLVVFNSLRLNKMSNQTHNDRH